MSKMFDGRCVKTIVFISPNRAVKPGCQQCGNSGKDIRSKKDHAKRARIYAESCKHLD
jgi:hypothetical protein